MNRTRRYIELIGKLRRLLAADQVEVIAGEIAAIAEFSQEEMAQVGVGPAPSIVFHEAMPDPSRRNVYTRTQVVAKPPIDPARR